MNEYEAVYLFREFVSDANQVTFGFFGVVYGFLVVSYLVADKLSNALVIIVLPLYLVTSMYFISTIYFLNTDADFLYAFIEQKRMSGEYDLVWFGKNPAWAARFGTIMQVGSTVGGLIASLIFFALRRKKKHVYSDD